MELVMQTDGTNRKYLIRLDKSKMDLNLERKSQRVGT